MSSSPHIGYKLVDVGSPALCTLLITGDTNEHRSGVCDWRHAKFRASSVVVKSIQHLGTNHKAKRAWSYYDPDFLYMVGTKLVAYDYESDPNVLCGEGIHYYRSAEAARAHDTLTGGNGRFQACGSPAIGQWCATCQEANAQKANAQTGLKLSRAESLEVLA